MSDQEDKPQREQDGQDERPEDFIVEFVDGKGKKVSRLNVRTGESATYQ
jgi:hypothetical protein